MRNSFIHTKPHLVLLLTCPVIALIGWLRRDYAADLQLYDTYFVLGMNFLAGFLICIQLMASLLYWLTRHRAGFPQLTAAHVLGTVGLSLYLVSTAGYPPNAAAMGPMSPQEFQHWRDLEMRLVMGLVTLVSVQLILVGNLVVKWVKG